MDRQAATVSILAACRESQGSGSDITEDISGEAGNVISWDISGPADNGSDEVGGVETAEEEESAPPTLTTSGYMTNSVSSCFSEMRASHTQDSLPQAAMESAALTTESWSRQHRREATLATDATSERAQWRALEERLEELASSGSEQRWHTPRHDWQRHHRQRHQESERERVLRVLSSCSPEDDPGPPRGGFTEAPLPLQRRRPAAAASGMELCFRNDAASDDEAVEQEMEQSGQNWQRFRRPPKHFVPSPATELTRPMQLCFISDPTTDEEDVGASVSSPASSTTAEIATSSAATAIEPTPEPVPPPAVGRPSRRPLEPELLESLGIGEAQDGPSAEAAGSDDAELRRRHHAELQAEAQLALAQAEPMARMQLEVERHASDLSCRDALTELLGVTSSRQLGECRLGQMSVGALQLVHNGLLARIEGFNNELVRCLMDRDDLHMEQDSMLVEIEDLTRRARDAEASRREFGAATDTAAATVADVVASRPSPVRRRVSQLTARLRPNKLVSLFTGT